MSELPKSFAHNLWLDPDELLTGPTGDILTLVEQQSWDITEVDLYLSLQDPLDQVICLGQLQGSYRHLVEERVYVHVIPGECDQTRLDGLLEVVELGGEDRFDSWEDGTDHSPHVLHVLFQTLHVRLDTLFLELNSQFQLFARFHPMMWNKFIETKRTVYLFKHFFSTLRNITVKSQQPLGLLN